MSNWLILTLGLLLFADADVPGLNGLDSAVRGHPAFLGGEEIAVLPRVLSAGDDSQQSSQASQSQAKNNAEPLNESAKLELIRYVSGEFAKATKPLPGGKEGFYLHAGEPVDTDLLNRAVATHGAAVHTGDTVQITKLDFRDHTVAVDLNGGGRPKKHWRDRIQVSMGGGIPTARTTTTQQENGPPGVQPGMGSTIFLEFKKHVPNLSPDELKQCLSPFLDFSKQRSASVQWVDTLPPEMKKAIQERRPVVGMDREEVIAAIGRPDHKVRERDAQGQEIEDWIYGQPPGKTIFVRFLGDRVTTIRQFPQ